MNRIVQDVRSPQGAGTVNASTQAFAPIEIHIGGVNQSLKRLATNEPAATTKIIMNPPSATQTKKGKN